MRIIGVYRVYTLRSRRGMVLITAMWIIIALAAVVLVLCREVMVESLTAKQHLAQARADAAEIGVEQFVLSIVEQELITAGYKDETLWEQRELGDCYFWVITGNPDDETVYAYGLTDEGGKVDINTWPVESLEYLPGADQNLNLGAEIVDWRDADDLVTVSDAGGQGEEGSYYQATYGYYAKNGPFESVEELRLLDGFTDEVLFGADTNHNGTIDPLEAANADASFSFASSKKGLLPFVTVYGVKATNPDTTSTATAASPISTLNLTDTTGNAIVNPIDVNNRTAVAANGPLQLMLTQVLGQQRATQLRTQTANGRTGQPPGQGATVSTASIFTSVFDWAVIMQQRAQLTSADFTTLYPYITALPPANPNNSTASAYSLVGKLNVLTASRAALICLPGFEEADADAIISQRESMTVTTDANGISQLTNIAWLMDIIDPAKMQQAGKYITGSSTIFSADIVTVSHDGRAFKRVKIVVDASSGTPRIIYRRDLTDAGWPLDPTIRETLRKGEPLGQAGDSNGSTPGERLSAGVR